MTLDPRAVARALGGSVNRRHVIAPGPGHSRADRSLSIEIDPSAPNGFRCNSFAGDDWRVRENLTLSFGLRYELQTNFGGRLNVAPRVGMAWSVGTIEALASVMVFTLRCFSSGAIPFCQENSKLILLLRHTGRCL